MQPPLLSTVARTRANRIVLADGRELVDGMVKTQYSLSDDAKRKGVPSSWRLHAGAVCGAACGVATP